MVAIRWATRIGATLWACLMVVLFGSLFSAASAVDCVGPDDPPGCVTPAPSVTPDPTPSVSPDPVPSASASASAVPQEVVLSADQFDAVLWVGGALLAVTLVGVVGSWSR